MSRFNPPPNWPPPPPGWTPPEGWEPDPSWPPPPDGWVLWIADDAVPGTSAGAGAPALPDATWSSHKARWLLRKHLGTGEIPLVVLRGVASQAIVGTDRKAFIFKKGFHAGAVADLDYQYWPYEFLVDIRLQQRKGTAMVVLEGANAAPNPPDPFRAPNAIPVNPPFEPVERDVAALNELMARHRAGGPHSPGIR